MSMRTNATTGLAKDWVLSPSIDLELKQYVLLGYLQRVKARFAERKLFPYLEQVDDHVVELLNLQRSKESLARSLGGTLIGFDPQTGGPIHERTPEEGLLKVIDEVIDFAVPGLVRVRAEGLELLSEFAKHIRITTVGLQPLHVSEGWLFLRSGREARVYGYTLPLLREPKDEPIHRHVMTRYVTTFTVGLGCSFEQIKATLVRQHPALPNPATFAVETDLELPCIETFVPLAKRSVLAYLSALSH